jgi:CDP-diacylglycerol--inositol 3-phosphatidyltransferase
MHQHKLISATLICQSPCGLLHTVKRLVQDVQGAPWLIRLYYKQRIFMGICCVSCEVLYLCCFLLSHPKGPIVTSPASSALLRMASLVTGSALLRGDAAVCWLAFAMVPGWLTKQVVNVHQMKASMDRLVALDSKKEK